MAEEAEPIDSKPLRGYDATNSDGLWVEWSNSDGAWFAQVTLYVGSVGEGNIAARQTFSLTNADGGPINDHTFTEAVAGTTYIVGLKYLPEDISEKYSESEETYTTITYTPTTVDPPLDASVFKIRDRDDSGVAAVYIGTKTASFVANLTSRNYTKIVFSWKESTAQGWDYDAIELEQTVHPDSGDNYEWDYLDSGYYQGWFQLDLSGLVPNTTYTWSAIGYYGEFATDAFEDEFTTLPLTKLPTPTGLNVTGVTESTSTLHWNDVQNASSHLVKWRKVGTSNWNEQDV